MKVFSHDTQGGLFSSQDDAASKNPDEPFTAQLFSILDQLENYRDRDGNFHFKLCYPELTWGVNGQTCNEWKQSSNPFTDSSISDFQPIFLAFTQDSYSNDWKGLGKSSSQSPEALIDDAPEQSYWSSAIGATQYHPDEPFIPGPHHPDGIYVTKVELYVSKPFSAKPSGTNDYLNWSNNPVLEEWSQWEDWKDCVSGCNGETHTRTRSCPDPGMCWGQYEQISSIWSQWTAWSSCSVTCSHGTRSRSRTCNEPDVCGQDEQEDEYCIRPCCKFILNLKILVMII